METRSYEEKLQWYRNRMNSLRAAYEKLCRRDQEYCRYLERWFSNERCDGTPNYETRVLWKTLPMPYLIYFS